MSAPLTVHNAQITTATVEIKTLTITGKQVTLAVFRQLREMPLVAEDGTLNGVPWGTVNYHPDKCADGPGHYHVVWQDGDDLRRSKVDTPSWEAFWDEGHDEFIQAAYCLNGHKLPEQAMRRGWYHGGPNEVRFYIDGILCMADRPQDRREAQTPAGEPVILHGAQQGECADQARYDELLRWVREDIATETARRERWRAAWGVLTDLPQLFIAV